ncbi:MAG TPA: NAD(P)-binding domain-containing protein [Gammaproteobacteria bacterium]|nr:NAD(P)-binding domain-containing protein [Gammaproteobacteria bacterium]
MAIGIRRRQFLLGLAVAAATCATAEPVSAESIAIIGTGRVAAALGPRLAGLGHDVIYGSREPTRSEVRELVSATGARASAASPRDAARGADIVILAVPGTAVEAVVMSLGDLSGKIIIDPTNPTRRGEDGLVEHAVATSNAELIQELAPGAHVVKAFNALSAQSMADPGSVGGPITIPLVGNDAAAKAAVAELVEGLGFESMDLGPVRYAHVVEGMLVVWINARIERRPFDYYFRRPPQSN